MIWHKKVVSLVLRAGEGVGKSTQVKLLYQSFLAAGMPTIHSREPGGTNGADQIRQILLQSEEKLENATRVLLNMAARSEHLAKLILPALREGKTVICDRFVDSTIVYQGAAEGYNADLIVRLHQLVFGNIYPDLTILLDLDPEKAVNRTANRPGNNVYELRDLDFHKVIRHGFLNLAQTMQERYIIVDAEGSIEQIHEQIIEKVNSYFDLSLEEHRIVPCM